MEASEVRQLIARMRRIGGEPDSVEVKSGADGYPRSVIDSIVSFANTAGGTIIIGIDESSGFAITGVERPAEHRDAAVGQAQDGVEPPAQIDVEIVDVDGAQLVVIDVPEAGALDKPLHLRAKGPTTGALIRSGDGDRRMTATEIGLLYAARTQPRADRAPVPDAVVDDLDRSAVLRTLERVRSSAASLRSLDDVDAMRRIGIVIEHDGRMVPTLAGLLTFGTYPQSSFPQLMASFVVLGDGDERFLDNVTLRGPIPTMVDEAVAAVRRNLSARSSVTDRGRAERLDFSMEAVREAVVNAFLHRDYSELTRGTQVQIELHPDRLVVQSPGGLYGPIAEEELGETGVSSSRNAVLAALLSDAYVPGTDRLVAENRASGIPTMIREAKRNGQARPRFDSRVTLFTVTMPRSALLGPEIVRWLRTLGAGARTPGREIALAMMRSGPITNEMLREWGMDRIEAGGVLRDLVTDGLAVRLGGRRFARYVLAPAALGESSTGRPGDVAPVRSDVVLEKLSELEEANARTLEDATGLHRNTVLQHLNAAIDAGRVEAVGAPRSPQRRYRLVR